MTGLMHMRINQLGKLVSPLGGFFMVINHQNQFRENGKDHFPFNLPFLGD
jgi:hypothetical protein